MDALDLLKQRFSAPTLHRRLVFWHDPEGERDIQELHLALEPLGVRVWEWTTDNAFRTKVQLEVTDPDTPYLLYARFARPSIAEDWLLDLRLYGEEFVADEMALLMDRLRVSQSAIRPQFPAPTDYKLVAPPSELRSVRSWLQTHRAFFRSQERVRKVERLLPEHPREDQLVLAVLAVAIGVDVPDLNAAVRRVLSLGLDESQHPVYPNLVKWGLEDDFWHQAQSAFGMAGEMRNLQTFFDVLAASHLAQGLDVALPTAWAIPSSSIPNTCRIFLDDALRSADSFAFVDHLASFSARVGLQAWLCDQPYEAYARCDTVPETHQLLLAHVCQELTHETANPKRIRPLLTARQTTHGYGAFARAYEALGQALSLQEEKVLFAQASPPTEKTDWIEGYVNRWFRVDQCYRKFSAALDELHQPDWLMALKEEWDRWYTNTFLLTVGEWTDRVLDEGSSKEWTTMGVLQQRAFFSKVISEHLSRERVFVIISDALRYEAGQELADVLRKRINAQVDVQPMQASLPTYTKLGMASLLPGGTFSFGEHGAVLRDGMRTDGVEAREQILSHHVEGARAVKWTDFQSLPVQDGEELIKGKRLVYVYHDVIDATGDQAKSETRTFLAVHQAIEELAFAVDKFVRSYRAVRIVITADHGFLYQPGAVEAWAKPTPVEGDIYDGNRRFAIGRSLTTPPGTRAVSLRYLGPDADAVVATGIHRLTVRGGGQRYVHGGAMPQEAIVPVITYRQIRGQAKVSEHTRVEVVLANRSRLVTSYSFTAVFFQEQKVSPSHLPRHLRMALYLDETRISTEATRAFDSKAEVQQRQTDVLFHLFERDYPMGARSVLRLEDVSGSDTVLYSEYDVELRIVALEPREGR